jgi:hypothetical protein
VLGAMVLLLELAWTRYGEFALLALALAYGIGFFLAGDWQWRRQPLQVPGGLLIALAVGMVPLIVLTLQRVFGLWSPEPGIDLAAWGHSGKLPAEAATAVAGLVAILRYRFPFILCLPIAALWMLLMDGIGIGFPDAASGNLYLWATVIYAGALIAAAWAIDGRTERDLSFWLYLVGLLGLWGALSILFADGDVEGWVYCMASLALMLGAVLFQRRAFAVFGGLGLAFYFIDLAERLFADSLLFPIALSVIGIAVIALGLWYYRRMAAIEGWLGRHLPAPLRALRPARLRGDG